MPQRYLCQATADRLRRRLANYPLCIKGQETTALINTRAEGDFISKEFVKVQGIILRRKR